MVIVRTKLMIQDDMLHPFPDIRIKFTGKTPERLYDEIPRLLQTIFRVSGGQIQEKKYQWTKSETEKFSVVWEMDKDIDQFTYYYIEIGFSGHSSKGTGSADVVVKSALRTEYPQDTIWERSILYEMLRMFWHRTFYNKQREAYLREGRHMVAFFVEEVKKFAHAQ